MGIGRATPTNDLVQLAVQDAVATITLNDPPLNVLTLRMLAALARAANAVTIRDDIRAVVITGANGHLSAGADIKELQGLSTTTAQTYGDNLRHTFNALAAIPVPVAVAIDGHALGGGYEIALTADYRVCARDASVGLTETRLGLIPAAGGTQRLARLIGPEKAKQIIFAGHPYSGHDAVRLGLVSRVAEPPHTPLHLAMAWAGIQAQGPTQAFRAAKQAINFGSTLGLADGLALETQLFASLFQTEDATRGIRHFLSKHSGAAKFFGR